MKILTSEAGVGNGDEGVGEAGGGRGKRIID
jgi:hypothetical protein